MNNKMTSIGFVARNKKGGHFAGSGCRCKVYSSLRVAYASVRGPTMRTRAEFERTWDFQEVFVAVQQGDDQEENGASIDRVIDANFTAKTCMPSLTTASA